VFNFSGSEIVFLLLLALIILGPEKLPDAVRKFGKTYAEFKKVTTGFQDELKSALDEPMREMRETADALRKAAQFDLDFDPTPSPHDAAIAEEKPAVTPHPSTIHAAGNEPPLAGTGQPPSDSPSIPPSTPAAGAAEDGAGLA
jgi:Tat protein translocase TatB subunit